MSSLWTALAPAPVDPATPWTAYTPGWTGSATPPAIGNGSLVGAYVQIGKLVFFRAVITMGSTTTYGTGNWQLTLPVTPKAGTNFCGMISMLDSSSGGFYPGFARNSPALLLSFANPAAVLAAGTPFAWAVNDTLELYGTYEAA